MIHKSGDLLGIDKSFSTRNWRISFLLLPVMWNDRAAIIMDFLENAVESLRFFFEKTRLIIRKEVNKC